MNRPARFPYLATLALWFEKALLLIACALAAAAGMAVLSQSAAAQVSSAVASTRLPAEVEAELPNGQLSGTARLRFFGFDIYDSRMWVAPGFKASAYAQSPLALELTYLRSLSGKAIAERSLKEMQRSGKFTAEQEQRWLAAMTEAFPDVNNGDRLTGMHVPGVGARFWLNGQPRATIRDADFSRYFFGIWLSEATSEPQLRANLLARATP